MSFIGVTPRKRPVFFTSLISIGTGAVLFYSIWIFSPLLARLGLDGPAKIEDKSLELLKFVGGTGGILFTFAFLGQALYLALYSLDEQRRLAVYTGMVFTFIGTLLFYSAWKFAPAISDLLLPLPCGSSGRMTDSCT